MAEKGKAVSGSKKRKSSGAKKSASKSSKAKASGPKKVWPSTTHAESGPVPALEDANSQRIHGISL